MLEVERDKFKFFWNDGIEVAERAKEIEAEKEQLKVHIQLLQADIEVHEKAVSR